MKKILIILFLIVGCDDKIDNEKIVNHYLSGIRNLSEDSDKVADKIIEIRDVLLHSLPHYTKDTFVGILLQATEEVKKDSLYIKLQNKKIDIYKSYCLPTEVCDKQFEVEILYDYQIIKSDEKRVWALLKHYRDSEGTMKETEVIFTIDSKAQKISRLYPNILP